MCFLFRWVLDLKLLQMVKQKSAPPLLCSKKKKANSVEVRDFSPGGHLKHFTCISTKKRPIAKIISQPSSFLLNKVCSILFIYRHETIGVGAGSYYMNPKAIPVFIFADITF